MDSAAISQLKHVYRPADEVLVDCPIHCGLNGGLKRQGLSVRMSGSRDGLSQARLCDDRPWTLSYHKFDYASFVGRSCHPQPCSWVVGPRNDIRLQVGDQSCFWHIALNGKVVLNPDSIGNQSAIVRSTTENRDDQIITLPRIEEPIGVSLEHHVKLTSHYFDPTVRHLPYAVFRVGGILELPESRFTRSVSVDVGLAGVYVVAADPTAHCEKHLVVERKNLTSPIGICCASTGRLTVRSDEKPIVSKLNRNNSPRRYKRIRRDRAGNHSGNYCSHLRELLKDAPWIGISRDRNTAWINGHQYDLHCSNLFGKE